MTTTQYKSRPWIAGFTAAVVLLLGSVVIYRHQHREHSVRVDSGMRMIMGTFTHIVVIAPDSEQARAGIDAALAEQEQIDRLMSNYKADSELNRVNARAYTQAVTVHEDTFTVLQAAVEFSRLSHGAFDITVAPLIDLWKTAADSNTSPTADQLEQARAKVGWQNLVLDVEKRTVSFKVEGMRLDLGGIAKGYAIDLSIEALKQHGALAAMVDIGGDIRCFNTPASHKEWKIGLQNPKAVEQDPNADPVLLVLTMENQAVATSGHYRRFALVEGEKVSHIIDTISGHGSHKLESVTILADSAMTADALATAVTVMGQEAGLALIEDTDRAEAIVIAPNDEILHQTSGAGRFVKKSEG